jgi:hypothetical protein
MSSALVLSSLESVLGARIQTLRVLKDRDPDWFTQQSEYLPQALLLVAQHFGLHAQKQQDPQRAMAMTLILINYILECQSTQWLLEKKSDRDPFDVAMALWRKYPMDVLVRSAISRREALLADLRETWTQARIHVRDEWRDDWYGITDAETETALVSFLSRALTDVQGLPIGTAEEDRAIRELLARVKEETRLARLIAWSDILNLADVGKFAATQFRRHHPLEPHPVGGVWRPFLCSVLANIMGKGWEVTMRYHTSSGSGTELFVCVDLRTMKLFLHRLMLEPESLPTPAEVAAKFAILTIQRRGKIFLQACTEADMYLILEMAQQAFAHMTQNARTFYLKTVKNIDDVDDAELMTFWGHRLIAYIPAFDRLLLDENRMRLEEPWKRVREIRSWESLGDAVARFDLWPPEERERFVRTFKIEPLLHRVHRTEEDALGLMRVWAGMRQAEQNAQLAIRLMTACSWERRSALVIDLCGRTECISFLEELRAMVQRVAWSFRTIPQLLCLPTSPYILGDALRVVAPNYTSAQWRALIHPSCAHAQEDALIIWNHLPYALRLLFYTDFYPQYVAAWFLTQPTEVFETFFTQVLAQKNAQVREAHIQWVKGVRHPHAFVPGGTREAILEKLWKHYLSRSLT